jgi:hypothetical protein
VARAAKDRSKADLARLVEALDERSRAILWHLWWYRHAEISELRELIDAPSDFEILQRLKKVINEKAKVLWGRPIVGFEQSRIDSLTGQKVLFSWWFLDEEIAPASVGGRPLVDVFNEKDCVALIAQLPASVDYAHTDIGFKNGILKVRLKKMDGSAAGREK